jgi:hypothetical protein
MRAFLGCGAVALVIAGFAWRGAADRRALDELPASQRQELYLRVLDDVERFCRPPAEALDGWCREQASFLASFPECDQRCEALAGPLRPSATR